MSALMTDEESARALNERLRRGDPVSRLGMLHEISRLQGEIEEVRAVIRLVMSNGIEAENDCGWLDQFISEREYEIRKRRQALEDMRPAERPYMPKVV